MGWILSRIGVPHTIYSENLKGIFYLVDLGVDGR
jgi:hypothetical protein